MEQIKKTNRQVIDKWWEVLDSKIFENFDQVDVPDFKMTNPFATINGIEAHKQMLKGFATAFPNYRHETSHTIEDGDWIAMEGTFIGDHTGPMMMGDNIVPPTNNHVEFTYAGMARIDQGKVAEVRMYLDTNSFLSQIGLS